MSAPMTRERLAELRRLASLEDAEGRPESIMLNSTTLRALLDERETLLNERESVRDAAFMEGWNAAVGECNRVGGEKALQFMKANREAARGALAVADAVFALKGKR